MKQKIYSTIFLTVFFSLVGVSAVYADTISTLATGTTSHLTIRNQAAVVFDDEVTIPTSTTFSYTNVTTGELASTSTEGSTVLSLILTADALSEDFSISDISYYPSRDSFIINCMTIQSADSACWNWKYVVNGTYPFDAIDDAMLSGGEHVFFYFGDRYTISTDTDTYDVGADATVTFEEYDFSSDAWNPKQNATVLLTEPLLSDWSNYPPQIYASAITNDSGSALLPLSQIGTFDVTIPDDYWPKQTIEVTTAPQEHGIENHVTVRYINDLLLNETIYTTSTYFADTAGNVVESTTTTALGVLTNALRLNNIDVEIINSWTYYISSIDGHTASGFDGWVYTVNQMDEYSGINDKILNDGDSLEVFYSVWPWRISTNATSTIVGNDIVFTAEEYDPSSTTWGPTTTTTMSINGDLYETDGQGSIIFTPAVATTTIAYIYSGSEDYPQNSAKVELPVYEEVQEDHAPSGGSGGGGCGSCGSNSTSDVDTVVKNIITFLDASQNEDGSFGSSISFSDWTAFAYNAYTGPAAGKDTLKAYLLTDPDPRDGFNDTASYAKRAMVLMSYGIDPYVGTNTNYIQKILDGFDGTQFGIDGIINDDIFALMPLLHAGYTHIDPMIVSSTKYILSQQHADGSFESKDLTGTALQILPELTNINGVTDAIAKAKNFLLSGQQNDGGFGDIYATPWIMQGLTANGVDISILKKNNLSPIDYIQANQVADGGIGETTNTLRLWTSAWAVPALLEKPWYSLLSSFSIPQSVPPSSGGGNTTTENSATSTPNTTTQETATSTEALTDETPSENTSEVTILPISYESQEATLYAIGGGIVEQTLEPEVAGVKITSETASPEESAEQASENTAESVEQLVSEETTATADANAPEKNGAKPVHYAFGATIFLGLLLGWRFLRTLV
ncbi:MAG TPA: hypothetical protein DEP63_03025 [Candidatus Magasanikbacteria bacterium]|uniref:Transcobalamin-like C-terminal domain-containing protein n=1 Tax=Candidatus Magasanikbacteria bacterium GW2011_GWE2_42_7 TaxID=1619052 RepID=A0A0G1E739_9BACT|nr:MAG: hypothetical protein UV18_C0016G0002 [Candidatus Magasanikbacteria bacterium GW2011_GWC2_42_27]KKS70378.1 MAG: hypothetical protein UV42_C0057G0004 [Candidatus Magasanikbacteria bacterium GW2011_GWE2_42_7]HBB38141.1 hypothetical protein [Candidatus Magasanikbacteria bacterium]HCC13695.1 hypothetical protein [Candidatus Magasanikbacteria bacterium]